MVRTTALALAAVSFAFPVHAQTAIQDGLTDTARQALQSIQAEEKERQKAWDREYMPAGFNEEVWHYLSRDQQIQVAVATQSNPRPLTKDSESAVTEIVRSMLKDPDSAKFRGVKRLGAMHYCGWVNAKNSFGGYNGYSVFFATDKWTVLLPVAASEPRFCA